MAAKRLQGFALVFTLAMIAAGCGGGSDNGNGAGSGANGTPAQPFNADTLKRVSLEPSDLDSGYKRGVESGQKTAQECLKALSETRESAAFAVQLQNLGLQACQMATYSKEVEKGDDTYTNSPGSFAFLFPDAAAASKAVPTIRQFLIDSFRPTGDVSEASPNAQDLPASGLGDEAPPGAKFTVETGGLLEFDFAIFVWRAQNVVAGFGGSDALGDMTDRTMLDIAKKIDYRATR